MALVQITRESQNGKILPGGRGVMAVMPIFRILKADL